MNQPPEQRQHRIHRQGAVSELIRRDEDYMASGLTEADTKTIWRAIMITPKLEVAEALLQGQQVPKSTLDPLWVRRFGL